MPPPLSLITSSAYLLASARLLQTPLTYHITRLEAPSFSMLAATEFLDGHSSCQDKPHKKLTPTCRRRMGLHEDIGMDSLWTGEWFDPNASNSWPECVAQNIDVTNSGIGSVCLAPNQAESPHGRNEQMDSTPQTMGESIGQ
ncbi:hypothetical protein CAPTEDRAFT_215413 [Capitella teleta]|uniref:Uncharacterized protein n=1 Tax=Capitella teleta TaxID=283909 RepID=R7T8S8_CAPTE|nr:hypothetical protein CAPTEDRAFT_215413 [Capitella teleta]|eukprot:ELT90148.1 hypothetical protein CAPTEDRAFT_215413 [Capitella teleta]